MIILVASAALVITLAGMRSVAGIIGPAFLALVLTVTVHPLRQRLERTGLAEWLASTLTLVVVYLVLILLTLSLVVSVGRLAALVPTYGPQINDLWVDFATWLGDQGVKRAQVDAVISAFDAGSLVSVATDLLGGIVGVLTDLFFLATLLLFLVFDTTGTSRTLATLAHERPALVDALRRFAQGTRSYMGVSAGFGFIVAVIDSVALLLLGIPGAFVWGVLAFVTNFIPNIGFVLGVVPPAVIALLEGGPGLMLAVVLVYSVINVVIQTVIQPRIVGDAVGLSATITFLSLVFWAWLIGPLGALMAVPLTLVLRALLVEADPGSRWVLPLLSGKDTPGPAPGPAPGATAAPPSDA